MKFFKLFENWNGELLNESQQSDLIQSIITDQPRLFADAVENIFRSNGEKLSFDYANDLNGDRETIDIEPVALSKGGKNTFTDVDSTYQDVEKYAKDFGKLILTFAGKTRKIRTPYGERICALGTKDGVNKKGQLNKLYLDRIYTLALCSKIPNVELTAKVAPGIGYEEMQIDNLDKGLSEIFTTVGNASSKGLPLFINGQDMGVSINGGVKVEGVPKSDLAFGINDKANFWVSYKHGEYINDEGVADKVSFQQYGSVSSFFSKKFDKAIGSKDIRKLMDSFFDKAKSKADGDGNHNFKGVTDVTFDKNKGTITVTHAGDPITIDDIDKKMVKELSKNAASLKTILKKQKSIDLTILATSGWSARQSIMDMGKLGTDVTLLSIFGVDYGGKAGKDNVNVLMQDAAPFKIGLRMEDDEAVGINVETSANGHVMFNPKMYGDSKNPPKFMEKYEPYLVARYTGGNHWYWDNKGIIGVRGLIMPKYHSKSDTDI